MTANVPLYFQIRDEMENAELRVTNWRGHMKGGAHWNKEDIWWESAEKREKDLLSFISMHGSNEVLSKVLAALRGGPATESFHRFSPSNSLFCPFCGKNLKFETNGKEIHVAGDPCSRPEGIEFVDIELNVPSGRFVVTDDLRQWFKTDAEKFSINTTFGIQKWIETYATIGVAMGFVGNSSPSLYKNKDKIVIGNKRGKMPGWGKKVAGVCTDLWWYSIADAEEFKRRLAHYTPDITLDDWLKQWSHNSVKVRPGVYRIRWYSDHSQSNKSDLFAEMEWIREPDPVTDHLAVHKSERLTALECCIQSALNWPTLHLPERDRNSDDYYDRLSWEETTPEQKQWALARAANSFMCELSGAEWHENGHPLMTVSKEAKRLAREISPDGVVPLFTEQCGWYPFSEGYGGLARAADIQNNYRSSPTIHLNETFVKLALNVAGNYLRFPPKPELNSEAWPPFYRKDEVRNRMKLALSAYRALRKKYTVEPMDPEYDEYFMGPTGDIYVEEYFLGPDHPPEEKWGPVPKILELRGPYVAFQASKLPKHLGFCLHPKNPAGCHWTPPDHAQRFAIPCTGEESGHFLAHAKYSVPLEFVAKVRGPISQKNGPLMEITFEYGDELMTGPQACRWCLGKEHVDAITEISEEEYRAALPKMIGIYEQTEADVAQRIEKLRQAMEK
jgi:hypothetical protein